MFDWQQLELVMCGMPKIDVKDWTANTVYNGEFHAGHKVDCTHALLKCSSAAVTR